MCESLQMVSSQKSMFSRMAVGSVIIHSFPKLCLLVHVIREESIFLYEILYVNCNVILGALGLFFLVLVALLNDRLSFRACEE